MMTWYSTYIVGHRRVQPLSRHVRVDEDSIRFAPPVTHQIAGGEAMILAAIAGVDLCQMLRCLFSDDINGGRLVEVLGDYEPDPVAVHAVWPQMSQLLPKVRCVVGERVKVCAHWQLLRDTRGVMVGLLWIRGMK